MKNRNYLLISLICFTIAFFVAIKAFAADVTLNITVPDAWVNPAISAINSRFPGKELTGMTNKQWAEYQVSQWLKNIVVDYQNRVNAEAALSAHGYTPITEDDVEINVSQ